MSYHPGEYHWNLVEGRCPRMFTLCFCFSRHHLEGPRAITPFKLSFKGGKAS